MNTKQKGNKPSTIQRVEIEVSPVIYPLPLFGSFGVRGKVEFSKGRGRYFEFHLEPEAWKKDPVKFITEAIQLILRTEKYEHKAKRK